MPDLRSSAAWYRARADEAESLIASLRELGDTPEGLIEALQDRIRRLREAAERLEALTGEQDRRRVNSEHMDMPASHRIALAKSREPKDRKFHEAIGARGYTLNSLAKAVGMSPAALSMARKKRDGKPMRRGKAEQVEALTGWPATAWPRLIDDE